jgi:hypothetical protein
MSALLSDAARRLAPEGAAHHEQMVVGVIAIAVLLAVLLLREVARVQTSGDRLRRAESLWFATAPLTLLFAAVVVPRIVALLS